MSRTGVKITRLPWVIVLTAALACSLNSSSAAAATSASSAQKSSAAAQFATGPLPDRPLPRGFQSFNDPNTSGRLIYVRFSVGESSARRAMRDCLSALHIYFDGPPQLLAAVGDPQDHVVQVILSANLQGQPVRGVATLVLGQSDATFGLILDRPDSLRSSFQNLSQKLSQQMPKTSGGGDFDLSPPTGLEAPDRRRPHRRSRSSRQAGKSHHAARAS